MGESMAARKAAEPGFSHRSLGRLLGLKTSNFILLVIQGKRNLSSELAEKFAQVMGLDAREQEYFLWCVLFGQATTAREKDHYWRQMDLVRTGAKTRQLASAQFEYYSQWYHPAVRELVVMGPRDWDAKALAHILRPKVTVVQVRQSLRLLQSLGMIRLDENGLWEKCEVHVGTAPEVHSVAVFNYQLDLIDIARASLENDPGRIRNFTTCTVEMNEQEYAMVVDMLTRFRRSVLSVSGSAGPSDRVYQLNLQLFPLSRVVSELVDKVDA